MSEQQSEREAFEAWAEKAGFNIHRDETEKYIDYHKVTTRHAWSAWQARAAISKPSTEQGWKSVDSGTMMTILVQLGFPMVNGEIVKRFRECEAVVLKVLNAKAQGYPASEGWAGVSPPPPIEPREEKL